MNLPPVPWPKRRCHEAAGPSPKTDWTTGPRRYKRYKIRNRKASTFGPKPARAWTRGRTGVPTEVGPLFYPFDLRNTSRSDRGASSRWVCCPHLASGLRAGCVARVHGLASTATLWHCAPIARGCCSPQNGALLFSANSSRSFSASKVNHHRQQGYWFFLFSLLFPHENLLVPKVFLTPGHREGK